MARALPSLSNRILGSSYCIRNLNVGSSDGMEKLNQRPGEEESFSQVARRVSDIIRTRPRWESTLLSEYPAFDFSYPKFFKELVKHQNCAFLSLRFFHWLISQKGFVLDASLCSVLFDALLEIKAHGALYQFLSVTNFSPEPGSLEPLVRCLFKGGLLLEALHLFEQLKGYGIHPSIETWNLALLSSIRAGRTDLLWKLYWEMTELHVEGDLDTVQHLIRGCCKDGNASEGSKFLRKMLLVGVVPGKIAFNALVSGFCQQKEFFRATDVLYTMIAIHQYPNIHTYKKIIYWFCAFGKLPEALKVFNDIKDRGYGPDRVMYTTLIKSLCKMGLLGKAQKLRFEMVRKGFIPNEHIYKALIQGFCKIGYLEEATKLYKEMCNKGYGKSTLNYDTMIVVISSHGKIEEALKLFDEMEQMGVTRNVTTYNSLIKAARLNGQIAESIELFKQLLKKRLHPPPPYTPLIVKLSESGDVKKAIELWQDMQERCLEKKTRTYYHIIKGLCESEDARTAMEVIDFDAADGCQNRYTNFSDSDCVPH